MKILALSSRVLSVFAGTFQLMDWKVYWDQSFCSISFLQRRGLFAACRSRWAKRLVMVSPLIVRLALEAGMKGAIGDGTELLSRCSVARASARTLI